MTSGAALAARAMPPDLIEDLGSRTAPRPAEPAQAAGGAAPGGEPQAVPAPAGERRRALDQPAPATAPGRPAPDALSARYLAPALKAAAAARARSARIRAEAATTVVARDPGPAVRALPPAPAAQPGWSVSERPAAAAARPWMPAPAAGRRFGGLSVAAAAHASTIAFQPVRRPAPPAAPPEVAAPAAPAAAHAPEPGPLPAAEQPAVAQPAPQPARATGAQGQRFVRTVAELERHVASNRAAEAGSGLVPRPTLPLVDPEPSGRAWLRLWSRR